MAGDPGHRLRGGWPELPDLPSLSSLEWPELPDLTKQLQWPEPPDWFDGLTGGPDDGGSPDGGNDSAGGDLVNEFSINIEQAAESTGVDTERLKDEVIEAVRREVIP
jgi:hypothetical protein